jgi:predicted anti-sigma-YlaC factor YlaD
MSAPADPAFARWLAIVGVRLATSFGAILGVVLLGRAVTLPTQALGVAIVLSALWVMATVPRALAAKWRSER